MSGHEAMDHLGKGQAALERRDFAEAAASFRAALALSESAEAHEGLSWALWWQDDVEGLLPARENAYRLYRERGDGLGAGRMASWLAADYVDFRGDFAIATSWRQNAHRVLDGLPHAAEHGWLAVIEGDFALLYEADTEKALRFAQTALTLGRELALPDIQMIALAIEGLARVNEGEIDRGMGLLDEAAAAALGGEVEDPGAVSWTLCYVIYACEHVRDFDRAAQWCDQMKLHADRLQIALAQGICRTHYAAVLIQRGQWLEAESELESATRLIGSSRPPLAAEGLVRLGDLRLRQGRFEEAGAIFAGVEWHPLAMLGLAELALEGGRARDAKELVERLLRHVPEKSRTQRAAALELLARIEVVSGDYGSASKALASFLEISERLATQPMRASASLATGIVAAGEGDLETARTWFEDAIDAFTRYGQPYEAARARLELATTLVALGRDERAAAEASQALDALTLLGTSYAERAATLLRQLTHSGAVEDRSELLTVRQMEILRLIARGASDRDIAEALVLSEHTVHRHVANILQRLGVASRAAAVGEASRQNLL